MTCSAAPPSVTPSSPSSGAASLLFVEGGGGFLPHFRPNGRSGFGARPRDSLAGLILAPVASRALSASLDLNGGTKRGTLLSDGAANRSLSGSKVNYMSDVGQSSGSAASVSSGVQPSSEHIKATT